MARVPLRYVHASHLGLNRVPRDVPVVSDDVRRLVEDAPSTALERFVEAAVEHEVDFALVTGRALVEPLVDPRTLGTLRDAVETLHDADVRLVVVPAGDPDRALWQRRELRVPSVAVLDDGREFAAIDRDGERIATVTKLRPAGNLHRIDDSHASHGEPEPFRVAVVDGASAEHADDLVSRVRGFDDLAIVADGRRWQRRSGDAFLRQPGPLHGGGVEDCGSHGCHLVDVGAEGGCVRFLPLDPIRREHLELAGDRHDDLDALAETAVRSLLAAKPTGVEDVWLVRWRTAAHAVGDEARRRRLIERIDAHWRDRGNGRLVHGWTASDTDTDADGDDVLARELFAAIDAADPDSTSAVARLVAEHGAGGAYEPLLRRLTRDLAADDVARAARRLVREELRQMAHGG